MEDVLYRLEVKHVPAVLPVHQQTQSAGYSEDQLQHHA